MMDAAVMTQRQYTRYLLKPVSQKPIKEPGTCFLSWGSASRASRRAQRLRDDPTSPHLQ